MQQLTFSYMKKVFIIAPQFKPIPANFGGVEGLITDLINENEIQKRCYFYVISKKPEKPISNKFVFSKIIYFNSDIKNKVLQKKYYFRWKLLSLLRKILHNRITGKVRKHTKYESFEDNYFGYCCTKIASKIKPDAIVIFGYDKVHHFWQLIKKFGNSHVYYHLHYCRSEDEKTRELVPNTIAVSKYVLDKWKKNEFDNEKSTTIKIGVDPNKFKHNFDCQDISQARTKLGLSDKDFAVIFVGRFRPGKGIIELLDSFNLINNNNIKLILIGYFDRKSENEKEYENVVRSKITSNKNIIDLGFVPNDQLPLYYACSNAQVVPTVYEEAAGLVTIEGMLAGLPIIITKSGGMPEYVDDECSIKLDINDDLSKQIALSITTLYENPELCKKMGQISKKCASQYTITNYYNNLLSFLFEQH